MILRMSSLSGVCVRGQVRSGLVAGGQLAEEAGDAAQPADLGALANVDARHRDGSIGPNEFPREAEGVVVFVDGADPPEAMVWALLLHGGRHVRRGPPQPAVGRRAGAALRRQRQFTIVMSIMSISTAPTITTAASQRRG
jgi:hypothetical protein